MEPGLVYTSMNLLQVVHGGTPVEESHESLLSLPQCCVLWAHCTDCGCRGGAAAGLTEVLGGAYIDNNMRIYIYKEESKYK